MLDFLKRPREDVRIDLPGVLVVFNHRLKIAFLYEMDSAMNDDRYDALEKWLFEKGYFLQVVVAAVGMPAPLPQPTFDVSEA